jgi:iron complex outermembrane receptor protein
MHKGYEMNVDEYRGIPARAAQLFSVLLIAASLAAPAAFAQEDADEDEAATTPKQIKIEEVVVTGSRLKRDTYTSISPLQIITAQVSREVGLIDPGTILQESTAASGIQIDLTFSGFRLDNGPGASTVDLRGLGAARTLFLVNGRRLAPSGVEGAPTSPDTNLIPGGLVQQYEVLLDGASSVYGSDAVAGVVNVILRKDFDGLELEGFSSIPATGNSTGITNQMSLTWGKNYDRGFIGAGLEYRDTQSVRIQDRAVTRECQRNYEETTDGQIRTVDLYYPNRLGMKSNGNCSITGLGGYVVPLGPPSLGALFFQPAGSNVGIGNFNSYRAFSTVVDLDNDGQADANFADYNFNGNDGYTELSPDLERTSFMAFGEYTFSGDANITPYFELQYNQRKTSYRGSGAQLFPTVNALNEFNPCNPAAPGGVDCGTQYDALLDNPDYAADFAAVQGATPAQFRDLFGINIYTGAVGPIDIQPVVQVNNDRVNNRTDLEQIRVVGGVRGDMPFMNFASVNDWSFDAYISSTESDGDSSRNGVRGDRLDLALGNYSSTGTSCDNDFGVPVASDTADGCVPVNMFAPSLYANPTRNEFGSVAETDYLFDSRDFRTIYKQDIASLYANGKIFSMPAGEALLGIGLEYRVDEIDSRPDEVAADGLFFGFFVDQGAKGEKDTKEFFAELEVPLLAGKPGAEELTVNVSTRHTKDEFYDGSWTYSGKLAWRPMDSLLLRGTVGTSYRAPNMRENFLEGQTGFLNVTDPCVIPDDAYDLLDGYIPELDNREAQVIANCVADPNVDPFTFVNGGIQTYSTEIKAGGATDLNEETSESFSAGAVWEQPFWTSFELVVGATYYEIEVSDQIIEPSPGFIVGDCYGDLQGDSPFCSRISRQADSNFDVIDSGFINRDSGTARGVDYNIRVDFPTQMFGRAVDLTADVAFNRGLELSSTVSGEEPEEFVGEFGAPEWKGRMIVQANVGDFRYTLGANYKSSVAQDPAGVDGYDNIYVSGVADTCLGPENGDVNCRDVGHARNYTTYDMSVYYFGDNWTLGGGIRNFTNTNPPLVDGTEVQSINNVVIGAGYDIFGRTAFIDAVYNWR